MTTTTEPAPDPADADARLPWGLGAFAAVLFLVSGATTLVYEVAWTRRLLLLLGSTSTASAVVLACFLGGLGLGGLWGGRRADRTRRPLALYGALEIGAGLWALLVPLFLPWLEGPVVALLQGIPVLRPAVRLAAAALVVVPGAFLAGATFPALLRGVTRDARPLGGAAAWLYGLNTLGAVAGALWAGFHGIFAHGVLGATRWAAAAALAVGLLALAAGARPRAARRPVEALGAAPPVPWAPLLLAGFSGFLALGLQAAGARILVFFVEGFTASFAAMLGTFLAGLAVGSLLLAPLLGRALRPALAAGLLLALAGAAVVAATLALPQVESVLREVRASAFAGRDPLAAQRGTALAGSALLLLAPALALGALFPLTVRWASGGDATRAGGVAGACYLANCVGCVAGPLAVLAVGWMGAQGDTAGGPLLAWTLLGLVALAVGLVLAGRVLVGPRARAVAGIAVGVGLGFLGAQALSASTPNALVAAGRILRGPDGARDPYRVLLGARSDEVTTASVVQTPPADRTLYTDEFAAAATSRHFAYMPMLGHLPALAARRPEHALVIAFGTGTTAGALASHDGVRRLEIVDVSPAVFALAPLFSEANRDVLADRRVVRRVDDGRNALLRHAADLDVITLEPLMPYTPAALPFYTREFYELARDRLREGGVVCQWVPIHAMPLEVYAALLRAFFEVFPEGSLWYFEQATLLLGRRGPPPKPDTEAMRARAQPVQRQLRALGLGRPGTIAQGWVASGRRVLEVLDDPSRSAEEAVRRSPPGPLSRETVRDERPFPEAFPMPRAGLATSYLADTLLWLSGLVLPEDDPARVPEAALADVIEFGSLRESTRHGLRGRAIEALADFATAEADALEARGLAPAAARRRGDARGLYEQAAEALVTAGQGPGGDDLALVRHRTRVLRRLGILGAQDRLREVAAARAAGDPEAARVALETATKRSLKLIQPDGFDPLVTDVLPAYVVHAEALVAAGRCAAAENLLAGARRRWPWDPALRDLASFVAARRRGVATGREPRWAPFADLAAMSPPCADEGTAAGRPTLAAWLGAFLERRVGDLRVQGDLLRVLVREGKVTPADLARELESVSPSTVAALDAERAALLRAVDPTSADLTEMLRDEDPAKHLAALRAAARLGFETTSSREAVEADWVRSADPARRRAFVGVALDDGSPWALERLLDLLADEDETVRAAAWSAFEVRVPAAERAGIGFDPRAPAAEREAARERARAWLRR